jgi:hypothetical protein
VTELDGLRHLAGGEAAAAAPKQAETRSDHPDFSTPTRAVFNFYWAWHTKDYDLYKQAMHPDAWERNPVSKKDFEKWPSPPEQCVPMNPTAYRNWTTDCKTVDWPEYNSGTVLKTGSQVLQCAVVTDLQKGCGASKVDWVLQHDSEWRIFGI